MQIFPAQIIFKNHPCKTQIAGEFQILVAAAHALSAEKNNSMKTHDIHAELVYKLAADKNVSATDLSVHSNVLLNCTAIRLLLVSENLALQTTR